MPDLTGGERGHPAVSAASSASAAPPAAVPGEVAVEANHHAGGSPGGKSGLANWSLRAKLVAVFALPTIAALFLAGLRIMDGFSDAAVYERAEHRIELSKKVAQVAHEIQSERAAMSAWIVSGRPADRVGLDAEIDQSQAATDSLRTASDQVDALEDQQTAELYQQAVTRLDGLGELREAARNPDFAALAALTSYGSVIDTLLAVSDQFGADVTDKGLKERHDALSALAHAKEYSARQNTYLRNAAIRDSFKSAEQQGIVDAEANLVSAINDFNEASTAADRRLYANTVTGAAVSKRFQLQALALQRARAGQPVDIDAATVGASSTETLDLIRAVQVDLLGSSSAYTSDLLSSVQRELIITSAIVVAGVLIALILMVVVARSLTRPLGRLRTNALQVAERHLPEAVDRIMQESDPRAAAERAIAPVPVHTTEEVGQVARAFDVVHGQAVRLAAEQALLRENVNGIFVNLSRRSQRLVERQLGVIDQLESEEQDPDQLASLFELDHLATRLRRNGESLLVLSGAGLAKSLTRPVPAADVIGAAVSEIEQYARVEVGAVPQVAVRGLTIHDLVHLLAELLDNATYFSEPETKVSVRAVVTRRNALAVQITDRGVGMGEDQVLEANRRLADPPDLDVSVTRRMGLYVVARLAKRHGIEVRLRENEDIEGGVIARIVVPNNLLDELPEGGPPTPPPASEPEPSPAAISAGSDGAAQPAGGFQSFAGFESEPAWPNDDEPHTELLPRAIGSGEGEQARPAEQDAANGLAPLDEPISLDDLVAGSSAAGPFLSEGDLPKRDPSAGDLPRRQPGPAAAEGRQQAEQRTGQQAQPLAMPSEQPRYVPVADSKPPQEEPAAPTTGGSALEDDVPTRRLPIYQSVLSRWFSEESDQQEPDPQTDDSRENAGYDLAASEEPGPDVNDLPEGAGVAEGWGGASDDGWQAARSLLETKADPTTDAGLPKRVPNAYLVPGSVRAPEPSPNPGFIDVTAGQPGTGAIARSADAARDRMKSFQRGYTSGRHALREDPAGVPGGTGTEDTGGHAVGVNGAGDRSAENGVKE